MDDGEQSIVQEMTEVRHPDIFESGDRSIVLGTPEWVTLEDGRQIQVIYSADGMLLFVHEKSFEMWSKTSLGLSILSQTEVYDVAIRNGNLVISGTARRVKGDTVLSPKETRDFVRKLDAGEEPNFPVSTPLTIGIIKKHEKPDDEE
jgi:hypothetical protein